jgi:hypothetical protein
VLNIRLVISLIFVILVFGEAEADPAVDIVSGDFGEKPGACIEGSCYASIREALENAKDNDTITLEPGTYQQSGVLVANGVTIIGTGAHLAGVAAEGKAALVIKGDNTTILGLEISNVRVPSGNGAAVRQEGKNLILRNVHFHDNEMGILTAKGTGILLVEDSLLENNGYEGSAWGHNIYAQGEALKFIRSRSLRARHEGHEIKSRAHRTIIYESIIASLDSKDSRSIDIPNGGDIRIRNSVIQKGPNSTNPDMIGIGLEDVIKHPPMTAIVENNLIIFDEYRVGKVLNHDEMNSVIVTGNTIVSSWNPDLAGNTWFPTRGSAGLPDYPALPVHSDE